MPTTNWPTWPVHPSRPPARLVRIWRLMQPAGWRSHRLYSGIGASGLSGGQDSGGLAAAGIDREPGTGSGSVTRRSEQVEKRADAKAFLGAVPEKAVGVDGVVVAAAGAAPGQVTGGLQVGHDGLDGALGQAHGGADVAHPRLRVAGDLHQHMPMPGQQRPAAAAFVRRTHPSDRNLARRSSREKTHEVIFAYLLTCFWRPPMLRATIEPPLTTQGMATP